MNAGIGSAGSVVVEEMKVAAFVSLRDFLFEKFAVAAGEAFFRRRPGGLALGEFVIADVKGEGSVLGVEFDEVAVLHESQRSADGGFRRDVKDASAVRGARHAGIGDAENVADSLLEEIVGNGEHSGFGNPGGADRAGVLHDKNMVLGDSERRIVNAFLHVGVVLEYNGWAFVLEKFGCRRGRFDDGAFRGKVAFENDGAALLEEWLIEGLDDVVVENFRSIEAFAKGFSKDSGRVEVEEVANAVEKGGETTGIEEVGHDVFAGRPKIGEDGSLCRDFVEEFERKINARTFGHSGNVNDCVGRPTDRHVGGDGIFERLASQVTRRFEVFPDHIYDAQSTSRRHS